MEGLAPFTPLPPSRAKSERCISLLFSHQHICTEGTALHASLDLARRWRLAGGWRARTDGSISSVRGLITPAPPAPEVEVEGLDVDASSTRAHLRKEANGEHIVGWRVCSVCGKGSWSGWLTLRLPSFTPPSVRADLRCREPVHSSCCIRFPACLPACSHSSFVSSRLILVCPPTTYPALPTSQA